MEAGGRPEFKATPALRRRVEELVSVGANHEAIARAVGCSAPTLRKHFAEELATAAAKKRAEIVAGLFKSAKGGNVTALKKLEEMTRHVEAEEALTAAPKPPAPGKKALADAEAVTAGKDTDWGDDLTGSSLN